MVRKTTKRVFLIVMAVGATGMFLTQAGCVAGREFRGAALPAVQSGVHSILDGLVDGLFAAIEPDSTTQ